MALAMIDSITAGLALLGAGVLAYVFIRRGSSSDPSYTSEWAESFSAYETPASFEHRENLLLASEEETHFASLLVQIQTAWSDQNIHALKQLCTSKMIGHFQNILNQNRNQGVENKVEDITVLDVRVEDAWRENNVEYATVQLSWSAKDYTGQLHLQPYEADYLVDGDADHAIENTERWICVRHAHGSQWLLSAIEQH